MPETLDPDDERLPLDADVSDVGDVADDLADHRDPLPGAWIRSRPVRVVVAVLVAIAMAAVMLGWAFLGMDRGEDPEPPDVIEVSLPVGPV